MLCLARSNSDSLDNIFRLVKAKAVGGIRISPGEGGGLLDARTAIEICRLGDVKCSLACVGSRILSASCLHLAAATTNLHYACQLAEFCRFTDDPASGLEARNGKLRVPNGPGLGIEVNV